MLSNPNWQWPLGALTYVGILFYFRMTDEERNNVLGVEKTPQHYSAEHERNYISYTPGYDRSQVLDAYDKRAATYHEVRAAEY